MAKPIRVLFVCLGNICRSPLAEVIVRAKADQNDLTQQFHFESAGTGNWHIGGQADIRSTSVAQKYGLDLHQHRAQQITMNHIDAWDWFIAMDHNNRLDLLAMGAKNQRVLMMRQFESSGQIKDVPDPYYGGTQGFEDAYQMLNNNAEPLLRTILQSQNKN